MIEYLSGDGAVLDEVAGLWSRLKARHAAASEHFGPEIMATDFSQRKSGLLEKAGIAGVRVDRAIDGQTGYCIAYCISSVDRHSKGEIDSIYVEPEFRGRGIGRNLMRRALAWLDERGVESVVVSILMGNEAVLDFYAKFGFYPRSMMLAQPARQRPETT